jgi:hypothetical protein
MFMSSLHHDEEADVEAESDTAKKNKVLRLDAGQS